MKKYLFAIIVFLFATPVFGQKRERADRDTKKWRYEIECVSEGNEGMYLVKIFSYSKKRKIAIDQAKKNAVHAIIFQGVSTSNCAPKPPLTNNPNLENEKEGFFNDFFSDGGKYMKYVEVSNDGSISAEDYLKVGNEYKIGVVVSVRVSLLQSELEKAGILKSLSSGF